jgi:integrase
MKDDIKGYLFKRKLVDGRQVRLRPSSPVHAKFYIQYDINRIRSTKCLGTSDADTARQRWADMKANLMTITDDEKYLHRLIESKENDIRRLQMLQGGYSRTPIAGAFDKFLVSKYRRKGTSPKTIDGYRAQFARFAAWCSGKVASMTDVSPVICERYIDDLEKQDKPVLNSETVDKHIGFLERMWKVLLPEVKNPWAGLHSTKEHSQVGYRRLSLAECRTLYKAESGEVKRLVAVGFATGQRLGDCVSLDWGAVNLGDGIIGFTPAKTKKRKNKMVLVPMSKHLASVLKGGSGPVFPGLLAKYKADPSALTKIISKSFSDNGVIDTDAGHASFHSFRHTFASMLDESGCPLQIRAYLTNHSLPGQKELMPGVTAVYSHPDIKPIRQWILKVIPKL